MIFDDLLQYGHRTFAITSPIPAIKGEGQLFAHGDGVGHCPGKTGDQANHFIPGLNVAIGEQ